MRAPARIIVALVGSLACWLVAGQTLADDRDDVYLERKADIVRYLAGFHTFNGKPLYALLVSYGVYIKSVFVQKPDPVDRPDLKPGDLAVTITVDSPFDKTLPCNLNKWAPTPGGAQLIFVRRPGQFPLLQPDKDDPLTYWAATGKCSPAYHF